MRNPHLKIPTIHVTGTNGKGSVIRKLEACLQEAGKSSSSFIFIILKYIGYSVGAYTSPFLFTIREDISINREMISKADYVKHHQICTRADRNRRMGLTYYIPKPDSHGVDIYIYIYIVPFLYCHDSFCSK